MMDNGARRWTAGLLGVFLLVMTLALSAASLLPLLETNVWWIRYLDFIRLHVAISLLVVLIAYLAVSSVRRPLGILAIVVAIVGLGYHAYRLYPFMPIVEPMAVEVAECPEPSRIRVMVANVQKTNRQEEDFLRVVAEADPDVLLVLETNDWWDRQLAALREELPHQAQYIPTEASFFGMHVLSRFPLIEPDVRFYFDARTPTIATRIALPDGAEIGFVGVHPRPPQAWSQPTTMRDAHLLAASLQAAESEAPSIVAGDFNAVPWERISRRSMRIGELLDPRVGRGLYPTFHTDSWLMSWPLDQVLYQDSFGLVAFRKLAAFGSDHYPILADLCHQPALASEQSAPAMEPDDLAEAQASIEAARELQVQRTRMEPAAGSRAMYLQPTQPKS